MTKILTDLGHRRRRPVQQLSHSGRQLTSKQVLTSLTKRSLALYICPPFRLDSTFPLLLDFFRNSEKLAEFSSNQVFNFFFKFITSLIFSREHVVLARLLYPLCSCSSCCWIFTHGIRSTNRHSKYQLVFEIPIAFFKR
jgi:hypothetical protein